MTGAVGRRTAQRLVSFLDRTGSPHSAPGPQPLPACEGIGPALKRGGLANLAAASSACLLQVSRHGMKKIRYQPGLVEGCLAGTGLRLEPDATDITKQRPVASGRPRRRDS